MRTLIVFFVCAASASRADVPELDVTLRTGLHHTSVDKDDGAPSGFGPRAELEAALRPLPWLSAGVVGAYSYYASANLFDDVLHASYDVSFHELWAGARLCVVPHWRVFGGATLWSQWERERVMPSTGSSWSRDTTGEILVGANVAKLDTYLLQIAATYSTYGRFDGLEHVTIWSLSLGLTRRYAAPTTSSRR